MLPMIDSPIWFGALLASAVVLGRRTGGGWKTGRQAALPIVLLLGAGVCLFLWIGDRSGLLKTNSPLPSSILALDLDSGDGQAADEAADELYARWERGALEKKVLEEIAQTLRARLARPEAQWTPGTNKLFLAARHDELFSDAEFVQFVDHQFAIQLISRPRVRAGKPWRIEVEFSSPGVAGLGHGHVAFGMQRLVIPAASHRALRMEVALHSLALRCQEQALPVQQNLSAWSDLSSMSPGLGGYVTYFGNYVETPGRLGTGAITGTISVDVFDPWRATAEWDKTTRLLGSFQRQLHANVEIVDPAAAVLEPDTDAGKAGLIRAALKNLRSEIRRVAEGASEEPVFTALCEVNETEELPDLAFEVLARTARAAAGTEWPIGKLIYCASDKSDTRNFIHQWKSSPLAALEDTQPGQQFEIVLRPSLDLAEFQSTRIQRPWTGGEIVLSGIVPEIVTAPR